MKYLLIIFIAISQVVLAQTAPLIINTENRSNSIFKWQMANNRRPLRNRLF